MKCAGYFAILCLFIMLLPVSVEANSLHEGWKLESETGGIRIYSRAVAGSSIRQVKATAAVNASYETVVSILTDYTNYKLWMNNITDSQVIEQSSDTVHYVYSYEDTPWPVQNRFCVSKMTLTAFGHVAMLHFESVPRYLESPRDAIEMARHRGHWKVSRNKSGCDVEYMIESHPGGFVPSWLANQMAFGGPSKTMQNLRTLAENKARP
jgi:hypothetical protein